MRYPAVAIVLLLLCGCAIADIGQATSREWSRDGATEQDLARDRRACTQQAARPTLHGSQGLAMRRP